MMVDKIYSIIDYIETNEVDYELGYMLALAGINDYEIDDDNPMCMNMNDVYYDADFIIEKKKSKDFQNGYFDAVIENGYMAISDRDLLYGRYYIVKQ